MALLLALFVFLNSTAAAQEMQQVQAIVNGVRSPQHAAQADAILRVQAGVIISRTDFNTRNLLLHTTGQAVLGATQLNDLLAPLGMSVRCYQRSVVGSAPFHHLDPRTCGTPPEPSR